METARTVSESDYHSEYKRLFDPLFQMLERAIEENFMRQQHGDIWKVAQTPEEAVELLQTTPVWDASIRKFAAI